VRGGEQERRALEERLGGKVPPGIAGLAPEHLADLLEVIEEAGRRQTEELRAAAEKSFGHVPRLLRVPIRRIMGG